jgi:hypothetical protein
MSLEYKLAHDEVLITQALVLIQRAVVLSFLLGDNRETKYMDLLTELEKLEKKYNINQNDILRVDRELDDEGLSSYEILDRADRVGSDAF